MNRKKFIQSGFILLAFVGIMLSGCKKKSNDDVNTDTSSLQQVSKDENTMSNASDDAMNDAATVASGAKSFIPCGASIQDSTSGDTLIRTVKFNGTPCNNKTKWGKIIVKRKTNTPWSTANTSIRVQFVDFKVSKVGKTITMNGYKTFTNVNGGVMADLIATSTVTIKHHITGSVSVLLGTETSPRSWSIDRTREFKYENGTIKLTVTGNGMADGYNNLVTWGTNRHGEKFYTQINTPVVHTQTCDWDPISGQKVFQIPSDSKKATVTFGYNSNNVLITGTECPTQCKIDWEKNGRTGTAYIGI